MFDVQMTALRGERDELAEAAEDLESLLSSAEAGRLELSPKMESWLVEALVSVDEALRDAGGTA